MEQELQKNEQVQREQRAENSASHLDTALMREALRLARRAYGCTSPNPMVGAILVRQGAIIGRGWHHQAGQPHAEVEAIRAAQRAGAKTQGATLFVTLEPCCTHGRTPPCTDAILAAGIKKVVVAALDPNPSHAGRGLEILRQAGVTVTQGVLAGEAAELNAAFNHWIVHRTPLVTVKAAMSLDGKIATVSGQSKWITGPKARAFSMKLRQGADAILVGVNTAIQDNPSLTIRGVPSRTKAPKRWQRIVLDPTARLPLDSKLICDEFAAQTIMVITGDAPSKRVRAMERHVRVLRAPKQNGKIDLPWLLQKLGSEQVTSLIVEGGGETNAQFLLQRLAHRVAFFYAPMVLGGRSAPKGVAGEGIENLEEKIAMSDVLWRKLGPDLLLTAKLIGPISPIRPI